MTVEDEDEFALVSNPDVPDRWDNLQRFDLLTHEYPEIWALYKLGSKSFWVVEEIDLSGDRDDFESLPKVEQDFIKLLHVFFSVSDGIVNENLFENFMKWFPEPEIQAFYAWQQLDETVHAETYLLILQTLLNDASEYEDAKNSVQTSVTIRQKVEWAFKWINNTESRGMKLVAFAIIEGVFFSGSFAALFWYKTRGLLKGVTHANELISGEENIHCQGAILIARLKGIMPPQEQVHELMREAVAIEVAFFEEALPRDLKGMNARDMATYVKYVANRLLTRMNYKELYPGVRCPFPFMVNASIEGKTNFFERKVGEYQKVQAEMSKAPIVFDASF